MRRISGNHLGKTGRRQPRGAFAPPSLTGIALFQLEAQSNGGTLGNTVDTLSAGDVGLFPGIKAYDNTNDSGLSTTATFAAVDYVLARTADGTTYGVTGPHGERTIIADGQPVGPTVGIAIDVRAGTLLGAAATGTRIFKASSPGKKISYYQSTGNSAAYDAGDTDLNVGYKWRCHGLRALRADISAAGAPYYRQAFIWWQGEANTNPGRDAANLSHVSIASYDTEFEKVYADHVKITGVQPPWFLIQLLPVWNDNLAARDPYTDALNAKLKGLCRWTVNMVGGTFNSITDNANGGHVNRYYVQHDYPDKLNIHSNDPHVTAGQQKQIGQAISAALRSIRGGTGWSSDYPLASILPLLSGVTTNVSNLTVTVDGRYSDPGTVYLAAVAAGGEAPSKAQVVAGVGGGILAAASTSTAATSATAGTAFSPAPTITMPSAGSYDIYVCLKLPTGEVSERVVNTGLVASAPPLTWDTTFNSTNITYTNSNKTATRTDTTGNRAVRSAVATGAYNNTLYYAEILVGQAVNFAGLFDSTVSTAGVGGTAGINRVGWFGANAAYNNAGSQALSAMGSGLSANDVMQVVYNRSTKKFWIRKNGTGNWNNTAGADPQAGTNGYDASGLTGEAYLGVTLNTTTSGTATIRANSTDWAFAPAWATSSNQWGG